MSDVDELRDRLSVAVEQELERWMNDLSDERREGDAVADRIIDEFGMTVRGDGCGYHEIYGSYDTRFES